MSESLTLLQRLIDALPAWNEATASAIGRVRRGGVVGIVNRATFRLDLCETIQRRMFLRRYELAQTEWVKQCIGPGDVFVDVGASFGYYATLGASLVGPSGNVFAFEPSPVASRVLEEAIEQSPLSNVVLIRAAVGSEPGSIALYLPNTPHLHSPSVLASDPEFRPIQVPVIRLDDFGPLRNLTVKLVKIDVEGYEPNVLRGMSRLIRDRRIENVMCEFNSWWLRRNATTPEQLHDMFLSCGFRIERATDLERNLVGHLGERFDLQDRWYTQTRELPC